MTNLRATTFKALAAAALVSACGVAGAADSTTLNVSATVNTVCKFMASTVAVAFGALDPDAGTQTVNTSVGYKCTNGASAPTVSFASGTGSRNLSTGGATPDTLAYTITLGSTSAGAGFAAAASSLSIQAQIASATLQAAKAGTYTEDVVLNISP